MRLTPENKAKIGDRILSGAAELFRERGYEGVGIDDAMRAAGLTRGAFYAHFKSKAALFAEVMRREHPLLRMLAARDGATPEALAAQAHAIFDDYLRPAHHEAIFAGCTLAALTGEASRAGPEVKAGYAAAWAAIVEEMARGHPGADRGALRCALVLASGAVSSAAAHPQGMGRDAILDAARPAVTGMIAAALGAPTR